MIYVDDSSIKVSGVTLPGIIKSLEIKDDALIEEQTVEGSTQKPKQVTGYDDAKVTIELILDDSPGISKEQKLAKIQNLFKKSGQDKPIVHQIINEHTAARKISKVIFKSLGSKEENKSTQLAVSLEFWAYGSMTIKASSITKTDTATTNKTLDPAFQSYLKNDRGKAPKTAKSPATDLPPLKDKKDIMLNFDK